jgi:hypothetical protein
MLLQAAKQAKLKALHPRTEDAKGRSGFDAHVGERGVKLSGSAHCYLFKCSLRTHLSSSSRSQFRAGFVSKQPFVKMYLNTWMQGKKLT